MQDQLVTCAVEQIRRAPFQPRRYFSEEALAELAASIREIGIIHPPLVRQIIAKTGVAYYELIAGERRVLAAKKAGLETIQVLVREICDEEAARASLIENVQRHDLDPMEVARGCKRLLEAFDLTQEELASKLGKKRSTVANYIRLLTLPEEIQIALSQKALTMGHAKALLSLTDSALQKKLQAQILRKQMTVRQAEKAAALMARGSGDCDIKQLESQLSERLGRKVALQVKKDHSGTLVIHFYGLDDFEILLAGINECSGMHVECAHPV